MASRIRKLFMDVSTRRLYTDFTSKILATPDAFYLTNEEIVQILAMIPNPDTTSNFPFIFVTPVGLVEIALGLPDQISEGGTFKLTENVGPATTSAIPVNATSSVVQTAVQTGWAAQWPHATVVQNGPGDYTIDRTDVGVVATAPTGDGSGLTPDSFVGIYVVRAGTASVSEVIRVICVQQPVAYSQFTVADNPLPSATVAVTQIQVGAAGVNAIYQVSINTDAYQGTFTVTSTKLGSSNNTTGTSALIPFDGSAAIMQQQINAGYGAGNEVTVTQINGYTWNVEYTGANVAGKDLTSGQMTGNAGGLLVPVGVQGTFNLATTNSISQLGEKGSVALVLEVRNDDGTYIQTWYQGSANLLNNVIDPATTGATTIPLPLTQAQGDLRYLQAVPANGSFRIKNGNEMQFWDTTGAGWRTLTCPGGVTTWSVIDHT